jgi:integrase
MGSASLKPSKVVGQFESGGRATPSVLSRRRANADRAATAASSRDGGYLPRPKSSNGWFTRAVKAAGIQAVTSHDLRHTCASLAVSAGVNVLALQRMLGHTSAKMTLDKYADLFDDDLDAVAVTLHARYSPESVPKMCPAQAQEGP